MTLHRLIRTAAPAIAGAVVVCAAVALPAAAHASNIYPPTGSCQVSSATVAPGGTVDFLCRAGTFSADEAVTVTVRGDGGADARIGMVRFAISTASATVTSTPAGALAEVAITLPSTASGTYNIAAVSASSAGGTAAVSIEAADGSLPVTGLDSATTLGLWIGGGALVLTGAALAVAATLRRSAR
ncbi:cell wall protein [Microbacterium hominis]|uniref:Cell wall protein n=1 Tax=Microbacterium hominis TaxID=162426 RepID=A0A7D4UGX7_9MICO|nr:cell wall protein [Microbacterium hominis]QKJ20309.1 cell wall protein [Microbacterium hominis]